LVPREVSAKRAFPRTASPGGREEPAQPIIWINRMATKLVNIAISFVFINYPPLLFS
jgi:hypothetical protein